MDTLIFSQTAIFRLQQLASNYYNHSGVRHKLAHESGILDLLREAATVTDRKVRSSYDAFIGELNKRQIDALAMRGVALRQPLVISLTSSIRKAG